MRTLALIAMACAGCFNPHYDRPRCGPGDSCPGGLSCVNDTCVSTGISGDGGGSGIDGSGSDGSVGGCISFATLVDTCRLTFDVDLTVAGAATYDTDTHVLKIGPVTTPVTTRTVTLGADQLDVISARNVHLMASATLRATGAHGLAIVASGDFTIEADAQIDVSAGGAGAQAACANGATKGQDKSIGAGGGGGGGFGADGGTGGDGNGGTEQGGAKGHAVSPFPVGFHGGCPGADGGSGTTLGGIGGKSGGALYVVAAGHIVLLSSAPLDAGGRGGQGGPNAGHAGGGGGGSGGLLILEAAHIMGSAATLAANGGGGGEGSDGTTGGTDGAPGTVTTNRAAGGSGGAANGSDGGTGGSVMVPAGDSVTVLANSGGGGGGGSVGFIRILSTDFQIMAVSPAPG